VVEVVTQATISAVVSTLGGPHLGAYLAALARQDHPAYEVIVVDNRPTAGKEVLALAERFGARVLHEPRRGISRARNAGARAAAASIVAFCDDDAVPDAGWLSALAGGLRDDRLGAATGRTIPVGTDPRDRVGHHDLGTVPARFSRSDPFWFETACFGGVGVGMNLALRRSFFTSGPAFCERLGLGTAIPGGEENHAFFMLLRSGMEIAYIPEALVRHHEPHDRADARRRLRLARAAGAAHALLLLVEHPEMRTRTVRYMLRGAGGRQPWRHETAVSPSRAERLAMAARGAVMYLRARRT
jgi:cellulose synthase/poly-beta-1,6-N-acetylglucosamine synthase-like glycosyltransferase